MVAFAYPGNSCGDLMFAVPWHCDGTVLEHTDILLIYSCSKIYSHDRI